MPEYRRNAWMHADAWLPAEPFVKHRDQHPGTPLTLVPPSETQTGQAPTQADEVGMLAVDCAQYAGVAQIDRAPRPGQRPPQQVVASRPALDCAGGEELRP